MKFEIGQEVVCSKDHSNNRYEKNNVYTILDIEYGFCKDHPVLLDLGITNEKSGNTYCRRCNKRRDNATKIIWCTANNFIPIQKDSWREVTFEEIKEPVFLCAN